MTSQHEDMRNQIKIEEILFRTKKPVKRENHVWIFRDFLDQVMRRPANG